MTETRSETTQPQVQVSARRGWTAAALLAATVFTVVTAEMAPVGLLTPIAAAVQVSEGTAGLALTVTSLLAAVAGAVLPLLLGRLDRRTALAGLLVLMTIAGALSAWSPGFEVLMAARVLTGIALGGVWLLVIGIAPRLVPARSIGPASALIFSGIAIASVLGIPAVTAVEAVTDWRTPFAGLGVLSLVLAVLLVIVLPPLPAAEPIRWRTIHTTLRNQQVRVGLLLVTLLVTGHFAGYTYVRPLLEDLAGMGPAMIGTMLLSYGIAGVLGNFVAGAARSGNRMVGVIAGGIALATLLFELLGTSSSGALVLLLIWGFAYGGLSVSAQLWLGRAAPDAPEAAGALLVGVFNGSIALGAFVGGQVADRVGTTSVLWVTGLLAVVGLAVVLANSRRPGTSALPQE